MQLIAPVHRLYSPRLRVVLEKCNFIYTDTNDKKNNNWDSFNYNKSNIQDDIVLKFTFRKTPFSWKLTDVSLVNKHTNLLGNEIVEQLIAIRDQLALFLKLKRSRNGLSNAKNHKKSQFVIFNNKLVDSSTLVQDCNVRLVRCFSMKDLKNKFDTVSIKKRLRNSSSVENNVAIKKMKMSPSSDKNQLNLDGMQVNHSPIDIDTSIKNCFVNLTKITGNIENVNQTSSDCLNTIKMEVTALDNRTENGCVEVIQHGVAPVKNSDNWRIMNKSYDGKENKIFLVKETNNNIARKDCCEQSSIEIVSQRNKEYSSCKNDDFFKDFLVLLEREISNVRLARLEFLKKDALDKLKICKVIIHRSQLVEDLVFKRKKWSHDKDVIVDIPNTIINEFDGNIAHVKIPNKFNGVTKNSQNRYTLDLNVDIKTKFNSTQSSNEVHDAKTINLEDSVDINLSDIVTYLDRMLSLNSEPNRIFNENFLQKIFNKITNFSYENKNFVQNEHRESIVHKVSTNKDLVVNNLNNANNSAKYKNDCIESVINALSKCESRHFTRSLGIKESSIDISNDKNDSPKCHNNVDPINDIISNNDPRHSVCLLENRNLPVKCSDSVELKNSCVPKYFSFNEDEIIIDNSIPVTTNVSRKNRYRKRSKMHKIQAKKKSAKRASSFIKIVTKAIVHVNPIVELLTPSKNLPVPVSHQ